MAERLHQTLAYIHNGVYQPGAQSRYFPDIDLQAVVARSLAGSTVRLAVSKNRSLGSTKSTVSNKGARGYATALWAYRKTSDTWRYST